MHRWSRTGCYWSEALYWIFLREYERPYLGFCPFAVYFLFVSLITTFLSDRCSTYRTGMSADVQEDDAGVTGTELVIGDSEGCVVKISFNSEE